MASDLVIGGLDEILGHLGDDAARQRLSQARPEIAEHGRRRDDEKTEGARSGLGA